MSPLRRDTNGSVVAREEPAGQTTSLSRPRSLEETLGLEVAPESGFGGADDELEPISPELILVSPPDVALRARALLPDRAPDVVPTPGETPPPRSIVEATPPPRRS